MAHKDDEMPGKEKDSEMEEEFEDVGAADETAEAADAEMGGAAAGESEMAFGEGEEIGEEAGAEYGSLDEGVMGLIDTWAPTSPEGEQYKQELQDLYSQFEAGGEEMSADEGIPTGFLSDMRSAAASRAFGGGGELP